MWYKLNQSGHNFAYATTAELLWPMQNHDEIIKIEIKIKKDFNKILIISCVWRVLHKPFMKHVPGCVKRTVGIAGHAQPW